MRNDSVDRRGPCGGERPGAGNQGAAGRNDIVNEQHRPASDRCRVGETDLDRAVAAANFPRNQVRQPQPSGEIAHPWPGFRVGADHDRCGIDPGRAQRIRDYRHGGQVCSLDTGENLADVGRTMKVSIHRDDAIDNPCDEPADHPLADRFAFAKGCVLAHVAEIGREQHEPPCARPPQRFGCEQYGNKFVVRMVEGGIDDRRRGGRPDRHAHFPVGKPVQCDFPQGKAKQRSQPPCIAGTGWQALNGEGAHSFAWL